MRNDRLTPIGLGIVVLGWAVLVADMTVTEAMLKAGNLVAIVSLRSDIVTIAQTIILSGFGLAVVGGMRSGFSGLRQALGSLPARSEPLPLPSFADIEVEPFDLGSPVAAAEVERVTAPVPVRPVPAAYQAAMERPQSKDRNYVILPNGAVEVETLLGTRVFASLDEARDFIR